MCLELFAYSICGPFRMRTVGKSNRQELGMVAAARLTWVIDWLKLVV